ncbi:MAG: hypothetical protein IPN59_16925 [Holophaga sp.]|nr:hypothetical protein [Holophaga sp.]
MSDALSSSLSSAPSEGVATSSLEAALKKIKTAAIAGAISAGMTLVFVLISVLITPFFKMTWASLVDVALIAGLSYGVYRKSRVSALALLCYFVYAKIYFFFIDPLYASAGLITGAIFIYFFYQGVIGCIQYSRIIKLTQDESLSTNPSKKNLKIRVFWGSILLLHFSCLAFLLCSLSFRKLKVMPIKILLLGYYFIGDNLLCLINFCSRHSYQHSKRSNLGYSKLGMFLSCPFLYSLYLSFHRWFIRLFQTRKWA